MGFEKETSMKIWCGVLLPFDSNMSLTQDTLRNNMTAKKACFETGLVVNI